MNYLEKNKEIWSKENYQGENIESFVFRFYGRILKYEFGMSGEKNNKLLDWGCGSGANLSFFKSKGFDVYGVDMDEKSINRCKERMPDIKHHLKTIDPKPSEDTDYFGEKFDVIIATQSMYYLSKTDLQTLLKSLDKMLNPGGIVFFTMMGTESDMFFKDANKTKDEDGLWNLEYNYPRHSIKDYRIQILTEEELEETFNIFEKKHIGFYSEKFRQEEPKTFHHIFVGQKKEVSRE